MNLPKITVSTIIFESDKIKWELVTKDKNDKVTDEGAKQIGLHTLRVEFDFANVTDSEILTFLTSTTSAMKMFQNNVTKHWTEGEILEKCKAGVYKLSVRKLLDDRKSKELTEDERQRRFLAGELKSGKTKDQIKAELEAKLAAM